MNPNGLDDILWFRGIPHQANRRSARFLTSFCIHVGGIGLLLAIVPKMAIPDRAVRFHTTLIAPAEAKAPPKPVQTPVIIAKAPKPALILRPLPRVQEAKIAAPKLE